MVILDNQGISQDAVIFKGLNINQSILSVKALTLSNDKNLTKCDIDAHINNLKQSWTEI